MFGSLPSGTSPQELFISPLENISSMDSQNVYVPVAPLNVYSQVSSATPPSTYSASPAPSDFSLPMHATQPHRMFEACAQTQTKGTGTNLDVDMAAYTDGLANFNIPLDMGLSYVVPEMPPFHLTSRSKCSPTLFRSNNSSNRFTCRSQRRSRSPWIPVSPSTTSLMNFE